MSKPHSVKCADLACMCRASELRLKTCNQHPKIPPMRRQSSIISRCTHLVTPFGDRTCWASYGSGPPMSMCFWGRGRYLEGQSCTCTTLPHRLSTRRTGLNGQSSSASSCPFQIFRSRCRDACLPRNAQPRHQDRMLDSNLQAKNTCSREDRNTAQR